MINPKELKIGNYIYYKEGILVITGKKEYTEQLMKKYTTISPDLTINRLEWAKNELLRGVVL